MREIGIFDGKDFSREAVRRLSALGEVHIYDGGDVASFLARKTVLFVRLSPLIGPDLLNLAPRLKTIVSPTTGLTHIDLDACAERDIEVVSLKGRTDFLGQISATPEHALGLVIALLRNYNRAFLSIQNPTQHRNAVRGHDLKGKVVGILGFGRVGRRLARALLALDAKVAAFDIRQTEQSLEGVTMLSSAGALADASDIFIIAASHENNTGPIVDATLLNCLGGKYLVNISRGELIDEDALLGGISAGQFAGVAIDVIAREGHSDNRLNSFLALVGNHNLIVTPHIAGATYESSAATELHLVAVLESRAQHAA